MDLNDMRELCLRLGAAAIRAEIDKLLSPADCPSDADIELEFDPEDQDQEATPPESRLVPQPDLPTSNPASIKKEAFLKPLDHFKPQKAILQPLQPLKAKASPASPASPPGLIGRGSKKGIKRGQGRIPGSHNAHCSVSGCANIGWRKDAYGHMLCSGHLKLQTEKGSQKAIRTEAEQILDSLKNK